MKHAGLLFPVILAVFFISAPKAEAKNWTIDYVNSRVGFVGQQGDSKFNGRFTKFTVISNFDPENLTSSNIEATIDTSSATTDDKGRDSWLPQDDWFSIKTFPQARFVSTTISKLADGYAAEGNLTIKDVTRPVTLKFTLTPEADQTHVRGMVSIARSDFHVGVGDWLNENYVKFGVDVVIDLIAKPTF